MYLTAFVLLRDLQQIVSLWITGHRMIEYVAAAAIIIALLLLIRRRKKVAFGAQRESTSLPMHVLVVVCRIRSHSIIFNRQSTVDS
jgi:hypothetical protein